MASDAHSRLELHLDPLRAYLRRRLSTFLRSRESLTDFVHGVCLSALTDAGLSAEVDDATFRKRLFRCARSALLDRARFLHRDRRDPSREARIDPASLWTAATPSRHASAREEIERLEDVLMRLPAAQRDVVVLARIEGLSAEQIARRLGRSVPAVWSLLSRSLARLATLLDAPDPGPDAHG